MEWENFFVTERKLAMKKSKWIVLLCLMLCTAIFLSSCGSRVNIIEDVYNLEKLEYEAPFTPTKAEALATYTGWGATSVTENVIRFTKDDSTSLYNLATAKEVKSITETDTLEIVHISGRALDDGIEFIWVATEETAEDGKVAVKTVIYDASGKEIATANRAAVPQFMADLILFDNVMYRIAKDGSVSRAFDYASLAAIPQIVAYNEDYYYGVDLGVDYTIQKIFVYDKTLNLLNAYVSPSYAEITPIFLDNGNLLIQYVLLLPDDAKEYSYIEEDGGKMSKYALTSLIYDVEDGEATAVELDYLVTYGMSRNVYYGFNESEIEFFNEDIDNFVTAYPIVDQRIDESASAVKLYSIDANGGIEAELNTYFTLQGSNLPEPIAPNFYMIDNEADQALLLNKNGEVVGDITNADVYNGYLLAGGKIYGYDLKMIYDYSFNEMTVLECYANCILFEKDGETYLYKTGDAAPTKIIDQELAARVSVQTYDDYFVLVIAPDLTGTIDPLNPPKTSYEYYNVKGDKIETLGLLLSDCVAANDDCIVLKGINEAMENVYYVFS